MTTATRRGRPRTTGTTVFNCAMNSEALDLAKRFAVGKRHVGQFLSRLVFEHRARIEARQEALARVQEALEEGNRG